MSHLNRNHTLRQNQTFCSSFNFFALFSSFFIFADKDAHENPSFYYINPHEFQSCASLSAQIKNEEKRGTLKN